MKRKSVILISLIAVFLLAGLCACKQEIAPEDPIPKWEKSDGGLQNLPDINTFGTGTGVTEALVNGLKNPPDFKNVKNLIVLVCEGLTTELIESSTSQYGELLLNSFPVKGTTSSQFKSDTNTPLREFLMGSPLLKTSTGIVTWGEASCMSMRHMASRRADDASSETVCNSYVITDSPFLLVMGKGNFSAVQPGSADYLNYVHKAGAWVVNSLSEAVDAYNYVPAGDPDDEDFKDDSASYLYTVFETAESLPSFRQEIAFSLAWLQKKMDDDGMCLISSYSTSSALTASDVQDFDEGVALAVKFVLENPDTALLVCGCPADGSEAQVCFFGLGKGVSAKDSFYECVSSLF